jgi:hypothetical protein
LKSSDIGWSLSACVRIVQTDPTLAQFNIRQPIKTGFEASGKYALILLSNHVSEILQLTKIISTGLQLSHEIA